MCILTKSWTRLSDWIELMMHLRPSRLPALGTAFCEKPNDTDGQGGLACCDSWVAKSRIQLSDWTELNWGVSPISLIQWNIQFIIKSTPPPPKYNLKTSIVLYPHCLYTDANRLSTESSSPVPRHGHHSGAPGRKVTITAYVGSPTQAHHYSQFSSVHFSRSVVSDSLLQ